MNEIYENMSETELHPLKGSWQSSKTKPSTNLILQRHLSSESECESGFHSDLSDELISSQPSTADSLDGAPSTCHDRCPWSNVSDQDDIDLIKAITLQLTEDVVSHMTNVALSRPKARHADTLLRVVDDLSTRHELVFESIVKRLGLKKVSNANAYQQTFNGVGNELFADGKYNWGRVVTMFAFTGWLARNSCDSDSERSSCAATIAAVAGHYMAEKFSRWISDQGGWETMERFFAEPEPLESKLWRGMAYTFVGLGVLAAIAAVR